MPGQGAAASSCTSCGEAEALAEEEALPRGVMLAVREDEVEADTLAGRLALPEAVREGEALAEAATEAVVLAELVGVADTDGESVGEIALAERDVLPVALGELLSAGEGDSAGTQIVRMRLLPASVTNSLPLPDITATLCGVENSAKLPLPST
jgi:hypothetical protein